MMLNTFEIDQLGYASHDCIVYSTAVSAIRASSESLYCFVSCTFPGDSIIAEIASEGNIQSCKT